MCISKRCGDSSVREDLSCCESGWRRSGSKVPIRASLHCERGAADGGRCELTDAGGPEQSPQALPETLAKTTRNRVCFRFKKICLCNLARCTAPAQHVALCLTASRFTQHKLQYGSAPCLAMRQCSDPGWLLVAFLPPSSSASRDNPWPS